MPGPFLDASRRHPITMPDGTVHPNVVYLKNVIDHPNIEVGDYSYCNDFDPVDDHAARLAPYRYPGAPERLVIGRFVQIAHGARFITASANHPMLGVSTYPFAIFRPETMQTYADEVWEGGDTIVGNDVWIGHEARIMPSVTVGDGAIIAAGSVVTRDVPPYAIMAGNPARPVRIRFAPDQVEVLLKVRWWDWPLDRIERNLAAVTGSDPWALLAAD